jgi:membrane protein DedA with SNARE-associated domain
MFEQSAALWIAQYGYPAIFLMLVAGIVGLPVPDQLLLFVSGYLVLTNSLHLLPTIGVAILGSICGITASYWLGRGSGARLLKVVLGSKQQETVQAWFNRFGAWTLVFGYFIPGVRNVIGFISGSMRLRIRRFAPFAYAGAVISSVTCVCAGYFFGMEAAAMLGSVQRVALLSLAVPGVFVVRRLFRPAPAL